MNRDTQGNFLIWNIEKEAFTKSLDALSKVSMKKSII